MWNVTSEQEAFSLLSKVFSLQLMFVLRGWGWHIQPADATQPINAKFHIWQQRISFETIIIVGARESIDLWQICISVYSFIDIMGLPTVFAHQL